MRMSRITAPLAWLLHANVGTVLAWRKNVNITTCFLSRLCYNGFNNKGDRFMSQYHADRIIDIAIELYGNDFTDQELEIIATKYMENLA